MLFVDITVDNTIWLLKPVTPSVYTAVSNPYPVVLVAVGAQWPWPWTRSYSMHIEECLQLTQTGYNSCLLEYSSTGSSCSSFFLLLGGVCHAGSPCIGILELKFLHWEKLGQLHWLDGYFFWLVRHWSAAFQVEKLVLCWLLNVWKISNHEVRTVVCVYSHDSSGFTSD